MESGSTVTRAGLLTGVAPISAALVAAMLAGRLPAVAVWVGLALVASGLGIGLSRDRGPGERPDRAAHRRGDPST